jgi:hypothetical protein
MPHYYSAKYVEQYGPGESIWVFKDFIDKSNNIERDYKIIPRQEIKYFLGLKHAVFGLITKKEFDLIKNKYSELIKKESELIDGKTSQKETET